MIKSKKNPSKIHDHDSQDTTSETLPVNGIDQSHVDKKSLMELLRSERMQRIGKYLGWLSGS